MLFFWFLSAKQQTFLFFVFFFFSLGFINVILSLASAGSQALWFEAFKESLGHSFYCNMNYD